MQGLFNFVQGFRDFVQGFLSDQMVLTLNFRARAHVYECFLAQMPRSPASLCDSLREACAFPCTFRPFPCTFVTDCIDDGPRV